MKCKLIALAAVVAAAFVAQARAADIVEKWASVKAPPAPEVKAVTLEPKTTALLVFDMTKVICSQRFAHCPGTIPVVKKLIGKARDNGVLVVFTSTTVPNVPKSEIWPDVAPIGNEPFLQGSLDKFLHTDLEKILKDKGIKTVITAGVAAQGAVIMTGSEAALLGFNVVVPVDAISAQDDYYEQYVVYHLSHAPAIEPRTTLTRVDMIKF